MKEKIIGILLSTLIATTIFAGVQTVRSKDTIVEDTLTEEMIDELLAENQEKGWLPDLIISPGTLQEYTSGGGWKLKALTYNRGMGYAHIFATTFIVDGNSVGKHIYLLGLASGDSKWGYSYQFSADEELYCTAWADMGNYVVEVYDGNNQENKYIDFS